MAAELPVIPRVVFGLLEPTSLVAGFLAFFVDTAYCIRNQIPQGPPAELLPTSQVVAWQLGNAYLLLGLLGVFILNTTSELKVVKAYLWALWLGDIGHVAVTVFAMGWEDTLAIRKWNPVIWGNVGATVFLFLTRTAYFLGIFDKRQRPVQQPSRKRQ